MGLTSKTVAASERSSVNRRANLRFPFYAEVAYKLLGRDAIGGRGETLDIGSGGVAFTTQNRLPLNAAIEVSINWPVRLDGACALKLVVTGRVLRSEETRAVVHFERYVFRTRAAVGRPAVMAATAFAGFHRFETDAKPIRGYAVAR